MAGHRPAVPLQLRDRQSTGASCNEHRPGEPDVSGGTTEDHIYDSLQRLLGRALSENGALESIRACRRLVSVAPSACSAIPRSKIVKLGQKLRRRIGQDAWSSVAPSFGEFITLFPAERLATTPEPPCAETPRYSPISVVADTSKQEEPDVLPHGVVLTFGASTAPPARRMRMPAVVSHTLSPGSVTITSDDDRAFSFKLKGSSTSILSRASEDPDSVESKLRRANATAEVGDHAQVEGPHRWLGDPVISPLRTAPAPVHGPKWAEPLVHPRRR